MILLDVGAIENFDLPGQTQVAQEHPALLNQYLSFLMLLRLESHFHTKELPLIWVQ